MAFGDGDLYWSEKKPCPTCGETQGRILKCDICEKLSCGKCNGNNKSTCKSCRAGKNRKTEIPSIVTCKNCNASVEVSSDDKFFSPCPNCGKPLSPTAASICAIIFVSALVIGMCFLLYECVREPTTEDKYHENCEDNGISAHVFAQMFAKDTLISPSSAEFANILNSSARRIGNNPPWSCVWRVISYVDAENAYGVTLRVKHAAEVKYESSSDTWHLVDLQIDE